MQTLSNSCLVSLILGVSFLTVPSSGAIFYVTPVEPSDNCPIDYPCHTLDYFAKKSQHIFENETEVSLLFLNGSHKLTEPLSVDGLERFEMVANSSDAEAHNKVVVHLLYQTAFNPCSTTCQWPGSLQISVDKLVIQDLEIHGKGEISILSGAKTVVRNLLFKDSGLAIQLIPGVQSPAITVRSTVFYRTRLKITSNAVLAHSTLVIENVQFLQTSTSDGGLLVICGTGFYSIVIKHITVDKPEPEAASSLPGAEHVTPMVNVFRCDKNELESDIYLSPYVDEANVTVKIHNANLIRGHNTGIHLSILPFDLRALNISVSIRNCKISGYKHGALVWNSSLFEIPALQVLICKYNMSTISNNANFIIEHIVITNNSQSASTSTVQAAGISVNSNQQGTLSLSNSLFQMNKDVSDSENIIWINNLQNFTIYNCQFINNTGRAISAHGSMLFASGNISFVDNAVYFGSGGALYLESSPLELAKNTTMNFLNNRALRGGAIFVYDPLGLFYNAIVCFLQYTGSNTAVNLVNNTAVYGGNQIYGVALKSNCTILSQIPNINEDPQNNTSIENYRELFAIHPPINSSLSTISSVPTRVCLCDSEGKPQCSDLSKIFVNNITVIPGELFTISAVLVGADFGTSLGNIYTYVLEAEVSNSALDRKIQVQNIVSVNSCTQLQFRINSKASNVTLYMHPSDTRIRRYGSEQQINDSIDTYIESGVPPVNLQTTPIYININLKDCPPGFRFKGNPPSCECYTRVKELHVTCKIENGTGYVSRTGTVWISHYHDKHTGNRSDEAKAVMYNKNCPPDFCNNSMVKVDLSGNTDSQCVFNRAGVLCGGCKEGYSLAIGSSHCIHCPNNNNLALLIFFPVAGLLLVVLIGVLNLTISVGMINGIVFYANIIWINKSLLFPPKVNAGLQFLKTFIAWINLDFGIETCFFQGLTAYTKTWLQFLFPFYLWFISGAIVVCCHYSTRMTNILGNRAVSILATLIYLSYVKLLRTIVDGLGLAVMSVYVASEDSSTESVLVWLLDGNLHFGHSPHIFLLLAVLATLLILWAPYTAALLFTQWLRKVSNWWIFRWTVTLKPFLDSNYASLKDKYQYWHGVLLFVRGVLVVVFALTAVNAPMVNVLLLSLSATLLLLYEASMRVYRNKSTRLFNGLCLLNLSVLGASVIFANLIDGNKAVAIILSVSVVFTQFSLLFIWNIVALIRSHILPRVCPAQNQGENPSPDEYDPLIDRERHEYSNSHESKNYLSLSEKDTY